MPKKIIDKPRSLDEIFAPFASSDKPGLAVGIAHHNRTIYRKGFGLASIEHGVANAPGTRMRIGSVSKQFTCLAALLLAEEGKLQLEDGVRKYLPELPELRGEPTLRQLMSHTSGYRCYLDIGFIADGMAIKPAGEALATQVRQTDTNFEPGAKMIYNNGGYHLLSLIIERVSGIPIEQMLDRRIFQPLGMKNTQAVPSDFEIHPGQATLHLPMPDGSYRRGLLPSEDVRGEGAMITTVDDMLIWMAHLRGPKKVGSNASWDQILTRARLNDGEELEYCLGLTRSDYRGVHVIHHAGGVIGGACQMATVPSRALDIIIITNGAAANPVDLANQVMDWVLSEEVLSDPESYDSSDYAYLCGRYQARHSGQLFDIVEETGKICLGVMSNPPMPLKRVGGHLEMSYSTSGMGPYRIALADERQDGGREPSDRLALYDCGETDVLEHIRAEPPQVADMAKELSGTYFCPDLNSFARICIQDDLLTLVVDGRFGGNRLHLEPITCELLSFQVDLPIQQMKGTLRVMKKAGKVSGCRLNTPRTRNLYFERRD